MAQKEIGTNYVKFAPFFEYSLKNGRCELEGQATVDTLASWGRGTTPDFAEFSILSQNDEHKPTVQESIKRRVFKTEAEDRAVGAMLGMVIGDAMGAPLEFKPYRYDTVTVRDMGQNTQGAFGLKPGQWTDDSSMGLCLADTLLVRAGFDPVDSMLRYLNWWNHGYNNAFAHDSARHSKHSVGLGGNISASFSRFTRRGEPYTGAGDKETSGVGSLMRLAPVPCFYHDDIKQACLAARQSSLVTHQGEEAAEACRLMTFIMVKAMHQERKGDKSFLTKLRDEFESSEESVTCLAASEQQNKDKDRDWNWQQKKFRYSPTRAKQQPGYIGSYAMDALAMALHCLWTTDSFESCLVKAVNICGDADSLGSVAGQMAGALYGCSAIPPGWIQCVQQWDRQGDIATKAYKLFHKHTIAAYSPSSAVASDAFTSASPEKKGNEKPLLTPDKQPNNGNAKLKKVAKTATASEAKVDDTASSDSSSSSATSFEPSESGPAFQRGYRLLADECEVLEPDEGVESGAVAKPPPADAVLLPDEADGSMSRTTQ